MWNVCLLLCGGLVVADAGLDGCRISLGLGERGVLLPEKVEFRSLYVVGIGGDDIVYRGSFCPDQGRLVR